MFIIKMKSRNQVQKKRNHFKGYCWWLLPNNTKNGRVCACYASWKTKKQAAWEWMVNRLQTEQEGMYTSTYEVRAISLSVPSFSITHLQVQGGLNKTHLYPWFHLTSKHWKSKDKTISVIFQGSDYVEDNEKFYQNMLYFNEIE